jgi:ubiquinone/menaquinone biosynthesis C-methylase UbiE
LGALAFDDASFDNVVCTLALCGMPDDRAAVAEMFQVGLYAERVSPTGDQVGNLGGSASSC